MSDQLITIIVYLFVFIWMLVIVECVRRLGDWAEEKGSPEFWSKVRLRLILRIAGGRGYIINTRFLLRHGPLTPKVDTPLTLAPNQNDLTITRCLFIGDANDGDALIDERIQPPDVRTTHISTTLIGRASPQEEMNRDEDLEGDNLS
jgi:hypothetical protein